MLRLKNLANKYQKRTCRPLYANTQATPYAANLDASFRDETGSIDLPVNAFTYKGSLVPGTVVTRVPGTENVLVATGNEAANEKPFGLLANFVGGDLDEGFSGDSLQNSVGVWRGPDAVFEILAPAFNDTGLSDAVDNAAVPGGEVLLYAGADGRLTVDKDETGSGTNDRAPVARLIEVVGSSRIIVDLIV